MKVLENYIVHFQHNNNIVNKQEVTEGNRLLELIADLELLHTCA
jgi:hypothetical protein